MHQIKRTDSDDHDFKKLIKKLDEYLKIVDGDDHDFYDQYNKTDAIKNVILYYEDKFAIGCGAFKKYDDDTVEIKRMYVSEVHRGKGIGAIILKELELWAAELNYNSTILETGKKQVEAISLYKKCGYDLIPNFGPYENVTTSVCMKKLI